jgi:uncharacterized glyoxalase superfamily protein PhnB
MIVPVLTVKDVEKSLKFYTEKLGFSVDMSLAGPDGLAAFAGVSMGKATLMLNLQEEEISERGSGIEFMLYLPEEQSIDSFYADVQAKGLTIIKEIKTEYWGDRVFSIEDPDGYYLTIAKTIEAADVEKLEKIMRGELEV